MKVFHRWLLRIGFVMMIVGLVPPAIPAIPSAQIVQASEIDDLEAPTLPLPDLPLPDLPHAAPVRSPVSHAPSAGASMLGTPISVQRSPDDHAVTMPNALTNNCSGTPNNPWAWWMRDSTGAFEFIDRSNVDVTDIDGGAQEEKRFYTTDTSVGVTLCLDPIATPFVAGSTTWRISYYRSLSSAPAASPTTLFATLTFVYKGTSQGTNTLQFEVFLNGTSRGIVTSGCTLDAICYFLQPLAVQNLGLDQYPGNWNARVERNTGSSPHPDLPAVERHLQALTHTASPNPIDPQQTTKITATFGSTPENMWMNSAGGTGKFHLYTMEGALIQELPGASGSRNTLDQTITYALDWNNLLTTPPTRPITDGSYLLSFLFVKLEQPVKTIMEPAFIQMIWPLYVGVPDSQLRNKGSCEYGCSPASYQVVAGDPVNTKSGNFTLEATDLAIPSLGGPLTWSRTYNAHGLDEPSRLGPGWTHPYALRLILPTHPDGIAGQVTVAGPSGNRYTFRQHGANYDPLPGVYARLSRDASGYTITLPSNEQRRFDVSGRLTRHIDSHGHERLFSYYTTGSAVGELERISDSTQQRFLTLTYTGTTALDRRIASVTDPLGRVVRYDYDLDGILHTSTDPMNRPTGYTTEDGGLMTGVTVNGEHQLTNSYESHIATSPLITATIDQETVVLPSFAAYTMADWPPAPFRRVITQTDGMNTQTTYTYTTGATVVATNDSVNLFTEKHAYRSDGSLERIEHRTATNQWITTQQTTFNPDTLGRTATIDRYGSPLRQASNLIGQTTAITDAQGGSMAMTYRPASDANAPNQLDRLRDSEGRETRYTYGQNQTLTRLTTGITPQSPQGRTTSYIYNQRYPGKQWLEAVTDPLGHTTTYDYNDWGQQTKITNALGQSTVMTYDVVGRLQAITDPAGRVTRYTYNADDTLRQVVENCTTAAGTPIVSGPCAAQTHERNITTTYGYDAQGRQIWSRDPLGRATAMHYGADNRVQWTVTNLVAPGFPATVPGTPPAYAAQFPDRNVATFYQYDGFGRTTMVTETGFVTGTLQPDATYGWVFDQTYERVTKTEYDVFGRVYRVIGNYRPGLPLNAATDVNVTTTYAYTDTPHTETVCDAVNRCTRTVYDSLNRVERVIERYQDGIPGPGDEDFITVTRYRSDGNVDLVIRNYGDGVYDETSDRSADLITQYGYDDWGRVIQTTTNSDTTPSAGATDVNLVSRTFYDLNDRVFATQDPLGRVQRTFYDPLGRSIETVQNCTGPTATLATGTCDPFNDTTPDRNIHTWMSYTLLGHTEAVTETLSAAERRVSITRYDALSRPQEQISNCTRAGQPSVTVCDVLDPQVATTSDTNRRTTFTYDAGGNLLSQTNPRGATTLSTYDALDHLSHQSRPYTDGQRFAWDQQIDGRGRLGWHEGMHNDLTMYRYDTSGRTIATIAGYTNGSREPSDRSDQDVTTTWEYDPGGLAMVETNPDGQETAIAYNLIGQPIVVIENSGGAVLPRNVLTRATYDRLGQRLTMTDPRNYRQQSWSYSSRGQPLTFRDSLDRETSWTYDGAGRMLTRTDARGAAAQLTYTYTLRDQQATLSSPGLSVPITMQYDAQGRRTRMTDTSGTTTWIYDRADRVRTTTSGSGSVLVYSYDAADNRTQLRYPPGGPNLTYESSEDNHLQTIIHDGTPTTSFHLQEPGRVHQVDWLIPQRTHQFNYDHLNRVDQISVSHIGAEPPARPTSVPAQPISLNMLYTFSPAGRHEQIKEYVQDTTPVPPPTNTGSYQRYFPILRSSNPLITDTTWNFTYDGVNRLLDATEQAGIHEAVSYDIVSNRTSHLLNGVLQSGFEYDTAHQRHDWIYDAVGNVRYDGKGAYTYDALNRVTSINRNGQTTTYTYNGDGLMVAKYRSVVGTQFVWDTTAPNAQLLGTTTNAQPTWYVWGPVGGGREQIIYETSPTGRRWYGTDAIGSVRQTSDDAGNVVSKRTWTPFGIEQGTVSGDSIGFAGEWQDATGLIYLRARWYDPQEGRFLSRDPWDGAMTSPQTMNPYAYAHNQPTRFTDPSGRWVDEQGNWHPCNLMTETEACLGQIPDWFRSNDMHKAKLFLKGVGKSIVNNFDPMNLVRLHESWNRDPLGTLVGVIRSPFDMTNGMLDSFRNCDYEAMGELTTDLMMTLSGGASMGGLVDIVGTSTLRRSSSNTINSEVVSLEWSLVDPYDQSKFARGVNYGKKIQPDTGGYYDVITHGNRESTLVSGPDGQSLTPKQIANGIRAQMNYVPGQPVRLVACYTGCKNGFAQKLANELEVNVLAPNDLIHFRPDGTFSIGHYDESLAKTGWNQGIWGIFFPE